MTPDRFQKMDEIFQRASALPDPARSTFVQRACADDENLRRDVLALLEHDEQPRVALDAPPFDRLLVEYGEQLARSGPEDGTLPERIGSYRILRKLGEGGFGVVFLAEQENPRRTVALKVLRSPFATERMLRRFEFEAQILGRLQHPGIAQIIEAGTAQVGVHRQAYFAMEHVRGRSLLEYAAQAGEPPRKLATRERLELFARICDALQYAHTQGVVHRDLKPDNILVDDFGQPKILDFGVARMLNTDTRNSTLATGIGQLVGTLPYMSPEQVFGDPHAVDTRSDVYSAGVVLYELLTGSLPHDLRNRSIPEATRAIQDEEPTPLSSHDRSLRGDVQIIVAKALEKDKSRRYQSAGDLAAEIRRYLGGEPIAARRDSAWYVLRKSVRRYRAALSVVAGFFIVVTAALAVSLWALRETSLAKKKAEAEQARAMQRFGQVRELANKVLFDFHDRIRTLPGATPIRQYLVTTALQYVDSLAAEAEGDVALQIELAGAYRKIGDVQGWSGLPNLGDVPGARASFEKARSILERVKAEGALDTMRRANLLTVRLRQADVINSSGEPAVAQPLYAEIAREFEQLSAENPDTAAMLEGWIVALLNLASSYSTESNVEQRVEVLLRAEKLIGMALERWPGRTEFQLQSARCQVRLGLAYYATSWAHLNDPAAAESHLSAALAILDTLVAKDSANTEYRISRISARLAMAELPRIRQDREQAVAALRLCLADAQQAAVIDPTDQRSAGTLEVSRERLGEALMRAGRPDEAIPLLEQVIAVREETWRRDPTATAPPRRLCVALERLGRLNALAGRLEPARACYQRALAVWNSLESEPASQGDSTWRSLLISACLRFSSVLRSAGDIDGAAEAARRAGEPYQHLHAGMDDPECLALAIQAELPTADLLSDLALTTDIDSAQRLKWLQEARERFGRVAVFVERLQAENTFRSDTPEHAVIRERLSDCDEVELIIRTGITARTDPNAIQGFHGGQANTP